MRRCLGRAVDHFETVRINVKFNATFCCPHIYPSVKLVPQFAHKGVYFLDVIRQRNRHHSWRRTAHLHTARRIIFYHKL